MHRHFLTGTAALGSLLALAACDDADTIQVNDANKIVITASAKQSTPVAAPGSDKASMFGVPREARILFW